MKILARLYLQKVFHAPIVYNSLAIPLESLQIRGYPPTYRKRISMRISIKIKYPLTREAFYDPYADLK